MSCERQELDDSSPLQRSVFLITYSQCDASGLTKADFARLIVDAWKTCYRCKIVQWVVSEEEHQNGGHHFHMAIKLSTKSRWRRARNYIDREHGIKVNFSDHHDNYYGAYKYVTKEDGDFILSPDHPDLSNATGPPKTTSATKKKKSMRKGKSKRKRLSAFDVVQIIQSRKISNRLELMALAAIWKDEGKTDLAEFVSNRGSKVVNDALQTAKELSCAQERLLRSKKSRIELLKEQLQKECEDGCGGSWLRAAHEILDRNGISKSEYASAMYTALSKGRGKYRNIYIYGPANCGKTFLVRPLKKIYECFVNPASGSFAWLGIESAEVVLLNDFRWKASLIPWCEFLQVLEGDTVHFPTPKNQMSKDIVLEKDTPFFATSDAPLVLINDGSIDHVNTEMMSVRWRLFQLHYQIPRDKQRDITDCGRCFAELILNFEH